MADITTHLDRLAKTVGPMGVVVLEEAKKEILALRQKWHLQHGEIERLRRIIYNLLDDGDETDRAEARSALEEKE